MGKSSPSAPAAPDPTQVSQAQTQSNQATALYNFGLDNPNVVTPLGSLSYSVDTSNPNQPMTTQNINLSPDEQALFNQQAQQSLGLAGLADNELGQVGAALSQPLPTASSLGNLAANTQNAYYGNEMATIAPQQQTAQNQLNASLANQGVMPGSQAYNNAQNLLSQQQGLQTQQALNNAIIAGPSNAQQLFNLDSSAQLLPLNALNALRSGSQAQMPQFSSLVPATAPAANVASNVYSSYGGLQNAYNQQIGSQNASTTGMYGLGGALLDGLL